MKKFITILFIIIISTTTCFASSISSIQADFSNKVFDIDLSDGGNRFSKQRREYNEKLLRGEAEKNISLYDRFGGDIKFVPYFGEKKFNINIADKFYTNMKENNKEFQFSLKDIFSESDATIFNAVYENRPDILEDESIDKGNVDPRRDNYSMFHSAGGDAALGNFYLTISKFLTSIVNFFLSSEIFTIIIDQWEKLMSSDSIKTIMEIVKDFLPLVMVGFVFQILLMVKRYMEYKISYREITGILINFSISIGLVFVMLLNTNTFTNISKMFIKGVDNIFATTLNITSSDIAKSDDKTNVIEATLWSKSVFEPWTMGMFDGRTYDKLYTQYANVEDKNKMPQSFDDIKSDWKNGKRYSSATLTGDVKVPVGPNKYVRNWAALAWSTQSLYHINAVDKEDEEIRVGSNWPVADRTANNPEIYTDNFRWLDAKMNISPGYISPDKNDGNYEKSNSYTHNFATYGLLSLWRTLIMLPILYPAIRKTFSMLKIVITTIRLGVRSIMSIFKEDDDYSASSNFNSIITQFKMYFWWSLVAFMLTTIYSMLTGNIISDVLWIIISYTVIKFKPPRNKDEFYKMKIHAKRQFNNIRKNIICNLRRR